MKATSPIPAGHEHLIPYLVIRDAAKAIDFYKALFDAKEITRMNSPGGKVTHAELKIGSSILMLTEEAPQYGTQSPLAITGQSPASIMIYVPDVDSLFAKAIALGAKAMFPPADMFWGDRFGKFTDPFGHIWCVATHIEDVAPEEMGKRAAAFFATMQKPQQQQQQ